MSKFYQTGSDSESEASEEETEIRHPKSATNAFQFSGDEEETKRVVRSAKEKRYEELTNIIKLVKNHKKIKDMSKLLTAFEDLCRVYSKTKTIVDIEDGGVVPQFYIHCLVELDNFVIECWDDREGRKNMSKNNSKSLTTLRQKVRKYNKEFEEEFTKYRLIPQVKDEAEESDKEPDSDNCSNDKKLRKAGSSKKSRSFSTDSKDKLPREEEEDGNDDDSVDWGSSSDEEASSSSDDERFDENLAAKFLKKTTAKESEKKIDKKEKKKREQKEEKRKEDDKNEDYDYNEHYNDNGGEWKHVFKKLKMFDKDDEIDLEAVVKKLFEILAARGRKGTDRGEQVNKLIELHKISENHNLGPPIAVNIMYHAISAIFDYNPNLSTCMDSEMWIRCLFNVDQLITKLIDESIIVGPTVPERELEDLEKPIYVRAPLLPIAQKLNFEFDKRLQGCDAHSTEYIERLKDEKKVCEIIIKFQSYYELEDRGTRIDLCYIYLIRIEHIYYKFDIEAFNEVAGLEVKEETSLALMDRFCKFIFCTDNNQIVYRVMLYYIYHLALHDNWYKARDLMLMSHLQLSISCFSLPVQIIHNHTMVQLGLSAFRQGHIKDAHDALIDIQSRGRAKELLAQGLLFHRQHERDREQEKIEKSHQLPFHMHINLELLECVYLVSAMLTEIPQMAAHNFHSRQRKSSKSFHYHLKMSEKQPLVGPPDSMREHVVAASKAIKNGNWKACKNFIINDKMNAKVWKLFRQPDKVRDMLTQKIKEESLRTYVCTNSSVYSSISIDVLSDMFELDKSLVHCTVCKMIGNEELMASLHEPSQTVIMHHTEPSRLQSLALQLADKVIAHDDNVERRAMELKSGMFLYEGRRGQRGRR